MSGAPLGRGLARAWLATELGARVASALVLAVVALLATWSGGIPFALLWLAAGLAVAWEWVRMTGIEPARPVTLALSAGLVGVAIARLVDLPAPAAGAVAAASILAGAALCARSRDRAWCWPAFPYAAVIVLVPPLVRDHPALGLVGVLWMFAVTWTTDVAAYFVGRRLGGPKLWPLVSPKKTWSGFLGGLLGGIGAGVMVSVLAVSGGWTPVAPTWLVALVSALASVLSQLGDLGESALKRAFAVKDSSRLIPGHGGVMDRLDGFWSVSLLLGVLLALGAFRGA